MEILEKSKIKWTYVTHAVDRAVVTGLAPMSAKTDPGALVLGRVRQAGKHKEVEGVDGRRVTLFPGDVIAGVLGHRYATDQYEGEAVARGPLGHLLGIGGVCGEVVGRNEKMPDPTVLEWVGRPTDAKGSPLNLRRFAIRPWRDVSSPRPRTLLVVGASMNAGKTTTAAQAIRHLSGQNRRVAAAKLTGTACRKDPGMMEDAGAFRVLDFTHCGVPSTAHLPAEDVLEIARDLLAALQAAQPEFLVYEIADGIFQRETRILLEDAGFRETIDAVVYAAPESPSCESGVRVLREWGYNVVAAAGLVANSPLGMAEVEKVTGLPCLNGEMILGGALMDALRQASVA